MKVYNKQKIFCIGLNKTGTTSLKKAMLDFGYVVGNQREAELMFDDWVKRDFKKLTYYCKTAEFFQDSPFSLPYTFIAIDQEFENSKFILTERDSPEQWYNSLINFHGKLWGNGNIPPTVEDLKNANYIRKGHPYYTKKYLFNVTDDNLYKKDVLIDYYETHNKNVKEYFRHRKSDLLTLNVSESNAYNKLAEFLNLKPERESFPWKNKTDGEE